jgi:hypothetical protein
MTIFELLFLIALIVVAFFAAALLSRATGMHFGWSCTICGVIIAGCLFWIGWRIERPL